MLVLYQPMTRTRSVSVADTERINYVNDMNRPVDIFAFRPIQLKIEKRQPALETVMSPGAAGFGRESQCRHQGVDRDHEENSSCSVIRPAGELLEIFKKPHHLFRESPVADPSSPSMFLIISRRHERLILVQDRLSPQLALHCLPRSGRHGRFACGSVAK